MTLNLTERDGLKRQGLLTRHLRWLSPSLVALVVVIMFGAAAPVAKADTYNFSLTDASHIFNIDFSLPTTSLTPTSYPDADSFQLAPVSYTMDGITLPAVPVSFYDMNDGGGLILGDNAGTWILNQGGYQLFTGDPTAPTGFILGTYDLTDWGGALISDNFTLTITDPPGQGPTMPTPEPSSLLLLGVGLFGMTGLMAYQQKRQGALLADPKSASGMTLN